MTSEQLERLRHHASRTPSEITTALFAHIDEQEKEIERLNEENLIHKEAMTDAEVRVKELESQLSG